MPGFFYGRLRLRPRSWTRRHRQRAATDHVDRAISDDRAISGGHGAIANDVTSQKWRIGSRATTLFFAAAVGRAHAVFHFDSMQVLAAGQAQTARVVERQRLEALLRRAIQNATARSMPVTFLHGSYVEILHRKKRARLVTYRHSEEQYLKNGFRAARQIKIL